MVRVDKSDRERERGCWMDEDLEEKEKKRAQMRGEQGRWAQEEHS